MFVVIGLDGATFDLIEPWIQTGRLPTLERLIGKGVSGKLESTLPPITAAAWASFMTGKNPGKHGVFDFFQSKDNLDDFDLVNSSHITGQTLWQYLSQANLKVGVLNVPITHPPKPLNGYLVPGLLSPNQGKTTYPANFLATYEKVLGPYRLTPETPYQKGNEAQFIEDLMSVTDIQINYMLHLAKNQPTDFLMVHFLATDIIQHALWKFIDTNHPDYNSSQADLFGEAIYNLYLKIDKAIGNLLEILPSDTTMMVMSDHGFGPLHYTLNLNNFFLKTGLLALKSTLNVKLRHQAFKYGLTPVFIRNILIRLKLHHIIYRFTGVTPGNWLDKPITFADVDWERTIAYSSGHMGQVYLNVQGRQPQGIVNPEDYEMTRQKVTDTLQKLNGFLPKQNLTIEIIPREVAAHGPYLSQGPDLHVIINDYQTVVYPRFIADTNLIAKRINISPDSGTHRRKGIFIASGKNITSNHTFKKAHLVDLAPTILHLMGQPVPDDMDGQVLTEILTPTFKSQNPITYQQNHVNTSTVDDYTTDEQEEVEARLRALGYLG